jgi:hypothetical protein
MSAKYCAVRNLIASSGTLKKSKKAVRKSTLMGERRFNLSRTVSLMIEVDGMSSV